MKMFTKTAIRIGCALLLLAGAAYQPALADCAGSVFFGNLTGLTYVQLNLEDPAASWKTYFFEDPTINQGTVHVSSIAFPSEAIPPGTVQVFGDWGAGMGLQDCPFKLDVPPTGILDDNQAHEVFVFSDSRGSTIIVTSSIFNSYDFDTTKADGQLAVTTLKPEIVRAQTGQSVLIELDWADPAINTDASSADIAGRLIAGYQIMESRTRSGQTTRTEVPDTDGSTTDSHAIVTLAQEAGAEARLSVIARLAGASAVVGSIEGSVTSPILLTPGLAMPGKGKGRVNAPGQNR